ncbi:SH3 domain-containing protein [Candidatus Omnitrophota bacterium]
MRLKALISACVLLSLLSISWTGVSFAQDDQVLFEGKVNTDGVNIRFDSTVSAEVVCVVGRGKALKVVMELYDWYKVMLPKGAPSFVSKELVQIIDQYSGEVLKERVNIRFKPSDASWIIGRLDKGELVTIRNQEGGWYRIEPNGKSFGWIHKKFLDKPGLSKPQAQDTSQAQEKLEEAQQE